MTDVIDKRQSFSPTAHADVPDWVNDYFRQINAYLASLESPLVEPTHVEPFRKYDGMFAFADGTDWNPGLGRGIYYWDSHEGGAGEWVYPIPTSDAFALFTLIGYGGVSLSAPTAVADIGAGWIPLPADTIKIQVPIGVVQDPANDGVSLNYAGVWQLSISFTLRHNEAQTGRDYTVRLFNQTEGTALGADAGVFVGRNQEGSNFSLSTIFDLPETAIGDTIVAQIGGSPDSFTGVTVEGYSLTVNHISEATTLSP